tara:strand:- start:7751 stop:8839 length:1089 start_codon:yes stop_codon:yes gene_type:complete
MDFYVILGVDRGATLREVKRAYTRLARRYHPDINPGDREAEAFYRSATEAYETLCDPERRAAYDTHGERQSEPRPASIEFHGFDFSVPVTGTSATFAELFSEVLRETPDESIINAEKGSDLYADMTLSFEEALMGTERRLRVTKLEACVRCSGTGFRRSNEMTCADCNGAGTAQWRRGHMVFTKACGSCNGTGRQRRQPCGLCRSEGVFSQTEEITVQIPAGVANGSSMRVANKGHVGRGGGPVGDLYITATVEPHRVFARDGDDLHLEAPISVNEAVLGATFEVPTVDGKTTLTIPPGTSSGQRFCIRGQGAPSPKTGDRGDLVVTVALSLPKIRDERSRELLREFGRLNSTNVRNGLFTE